jgi:beta-lactamase class A
MALQAIQEELPEVKKIFSLGEKTILKKKKGRKVGFPNSRKMTLVLFAATVLASLFFYCQPEVKKIWQEATSPVIISTLPEKFDAQPVLAEMKTLTQNLRGTYGFYVFQLEDRQEYGLHQKEIFPAASLIKLPVMLTLYQEGEKGNLDLSQYQTWLEAMGKRSDNGSFNQAVRLLGEKKIQKTITDLGMIQTNFKENSTTPQEIGLFFQKLYQGGLITQEHQKEFLDYLTETAFEERIPAGIPEGVRVAHKIGTEIGSFSDAGIVFARQPFILVIISKNAREAEANQVLPEIAKAVWVFEKEAP